MMSMRLSIMILMILSNDANETQHYDTDGTQMGPMRLSIMILLRLSIMTQIRLSIMTEMRPSVMTLMRLSIRHQ